MAAGSAVDRAAVAANLATFRRIGITRPGLRAASVAVCVLLRQDVPCLLITRRAACGTTPDNGRCLAEAASPASPPRTLR